VDRLVAVGQIGARDQVQEVVGARAAHDARGIEAEGTADGFAQRRRGAVGVIAQAACHRAIGLDRDRARAERRLVRRELAPAAPGASLRPGT
jgi:hypothetical protein